MKTRYAVLCLMLCLSVSASATQAQDAYQATLNQEVKFIIDLQADLQRSKAQRKPLLILFSQTDCRFCHNVRSQFLKHLALNASAPVIVREVMHDTAQNLGQETASTFTKRMGIKFFPTVVLYDAQLKRLAEPLLGSDTSGFYGAFLERAIDEALATLR